MAEREMRQRGRSREQNTPEPVVPEAGRNKFPLGSNSIGAAQLASGGDPLQREVLRPPSLQQELAEHAGQTVENRSHTFVVREDGAIVVVRAMKGAHPQKGTVLAETGKYADAWRAARSLVLEPNYTYAPDGEDTSIEYRPNKDGRVPKVEGIRVKRDTPVREPTDKDKPMMLTDGKGPPGTVVRKDKAVIPKSSTATLAEFDATRQHALIELAGGLLWVDASALSFAQTTIKKRLSLDDAEHRGTGYGGIYLFQHEGERHFVHEDQIDPFDLTYATALDGDAGGARSVNKDAKGAAHGYNRRDTENSFTVAEATATGRVVCWAKGRLLDEAGERTGGQADGPCVMLAERTGKRKKAETQVQLFTGTITWVEGTVRPYGPARAFTLEQREDGLWLVAKREAQQLAPSVKEYPIEREVAEMLLAQQRENVDKLLSAQRYTEDQKALLAQVDAFIADPSLGRSMFALRIPEDKRTEEGETLSADLIDRMDRFYRFLQYANLITGPVREIGSGIRSRAMAHRLSTRYGIHTQLGAGNPAKQLRFAEEIVALAKKDPTGAGEWATEDEIAAFRIGLEQLDKDEQAAMTKIGSTIESVQKHTAPQGAQASEGYPIGAAERTPNPRADDVGVSNHCGGEAIDVTFPFVLNWYDPILDALALKFGLVRAVKDSKGSPEHWHYERVGANTGSEE